MTTNLSEGFENRYYRVTKPFQVLRKVGCADSNSYYGNSMILRNVHERTLLQPGDEVHAYASIHVLHAGEFLEAVLQVDDKGAFEKRYGQPHEQWPLECLREISKGEATVWRRCDTELRLTWDAAAACELRGINVIASPEQVGAWRLQQAIGQQPTAVP